MPRIRVSVLLFVFPVVVAVHPRVCVHYYFISALALLRTPVGQLTQY